MTGTTSEIDGKASSLLRVSLTDGFKILSIAALIFLVYGWILKDLAADWWNDPSASQGLLIPPLAFYIAWIRKEQISASPIIPADRGMLVIILAALLFLLGKVGAEFFLSRISFVILLVGLVWTFWGSPRLKVLAFPFALLATMVPFPALLNNSIAAPLQLFASETATRLAQAVGVTVYRDGNIIHLAHTSLGVEEACSGLNSLSALMVASLLLGFLIISRPSARLVLFLLAIPLSIAVNIVRVTGTAVIADYHEEFAMGFYHLFSGWLVFIGGFGMLFLIAKLLHTLMDPTRRIEIAN